MNTMWITEQHHQRLCDSDNPWPPVKLLCELKYQGNRPDEWRYKFSFSFYLSSRTFSLPAPNILLPSPLQSHDRQGGAAQTSSTDIVSIRSLVQPWLLRSPFIYYRPPLLPPVSANPASVPLCLSISPASFTESPINYLPYWTRCGLVKQILEKTEEVVACYFFSTCFGPAVNPPSKCNNQCVSLKDRSRLHMFKIPPAVMDPLRCSPNSALLFSFKECFHVFLIIILVIQPPKIECFSHQLQQVAIMGEKHKNLTVHNQFITEQQTGKISDELENIWSIQQLNCWIFPSRVDEKG